MTAPVRNRYREWVCDDFHNSDYRIGKALGFLSALEQERQRSAKLLKALKNISERRKRCSSIISCNCISKWMVEEKARQRLVEKLWKVLEEK